MTDELGARIIAEGFAPNEYLLNLNGSLAVPYGFPLPAPWNLPSRMFKFPIAVRKPDGDEPRHLGLHHPALAAHPFVQRVEAALGVTLDPNGAPNKHGYSQCRNFQWFHAIDPVCAGRWRELLETAEFTTPRDIFNAVVFGLQSSHHSGARKGYLTVAEARAIMEELGASEPDSRSAALLELDEPMPCRLDDKAMRWPINGKASSPEDTAWSAIIGIEEGWFEYDRAGFLNWSEKGRDRYAAGDASIYVEATGQAAFAF